MSQELNDLELYRLRRSELLKPERVCYMIDTCYEMDSPHSGGNRLQAVSAIIERKLNLCKNHQFAIATFNSAGEVEWKCQYTSKSSDIEEALDNITIDYSESLPSIDLTSLTTTATQNCLGFNDMTKYVVRHVLIYGRSTHIPINSPIPESISNISVYVDAWYVHHRSTNEEGALCQEIFDAIYNIHQDSGKINYFVESHNSLIRHVSATAALLCHAVQRGVLYGSDGFMGKLDPSKEMLEEIRKNRQLLFEASSVAQKRSEESLTSSSSTKKSQPSTMMGFFSR